MLLPPFIRSRTAVTALVFTLLASPWGAAEEKTAARGAVSGAESGERTDEWIIEIAPGRSAQTVAATLGYEHVRGTALPNFHVVRIPDSARFSARAARDVGTRLEASPGVVAADQLVRREFELRPVPADPLYANQWHLANTGQSTGTAGEDVDIVAAWQAGVTGSGVVIGVVDDGVQYGHPDFGNYDATRSYDYFDGDADADPGTAAHGTSAAGIAAAESDGVCGAGAGFGATLAAQRLIVGGFTDIQEGDALANNLAADSSGTSLDISSNSWGPSDSGATLGAPGIYSAANIEARVQDGRNGLGWIYVWANGNGHANADWSGADGYASSRYTIGVAATDHDGNQSWYSEGGANILVNAPSSGDGVGTTTTDLLGAAGYNGIAGNTDCTNGYGGTSSAAPLVAGIVSLMLEANPTLGWRDVQYILAETAEQNDPTDASWIANGAGVLHSEFYGFGRVNASAAVLAAADWMPLPDAISHETGVQVVNATIPDAGASQFTFPVASSIAKLEHVEVTINAAADFRGDLELVLTSPSGHSSLLMKRRVSDGSANGWNDWTFTSVGFWGEDPDGTWTLEARDAFAQDALTLNDYAVTLYGLAERTVGGTVSGLAGTGLVLQLNGGSDLAIASDGAFTFPATLTDGSDYAVTVAAQPDDPGQTCSVPDGSGTLAGSDVADVTVTCVTDTFTIGGTVSGLAGSGLVLQLNGGSDLAIASDGSFTFPDALADGSDYSVTVAAQPDDPSQTCSVPDGGGTLAGADVTDVAVTCVTDTFSVGGTVSGLAGPGLVLQLNGGNDVAVSSDGAFVFPAELTDGSSYTVSVAAEPSDPSQTCSVERSGGTLAGSDVMDIAVICVIDETDLTLDLVQDATGFAAERTLIHTMLATNLGPGAVSAARLSNQTSAGFGEAAWTCQAFSGASCPASTGTGAIDLALDLPAGGSVLIEWSGQAKPGFEGLLEHEARIESTPTVTDTRPSNDSASAAFQTDAVFENGFE
jgi:subtilisin-like proprotein convertase family protein